MKKGIFIVLLAGLVSACTHKENPLASLPDISAVRAETRLPVGTVARTGEPCPQTGVWRVSLAKGMVAEAERNFRKGMALPSLTIYRPRLFAWLDDWMGFREQTMQVTWQLVSYLNEA